MKSYTILITFLLIGSLGLAQGRSQEAKNKHKNNVEHKKEQSDIKQKGNSKNNNETKQDQKAKKKEKEQHQGKPEHADKDKTEKSNNGKGHAYGKDKEGLTGREFGQKRSGEAKAGKDIKDDSEAEEIVQQVEQENQIIIQEVKGKIEKAREILEEKKVKGEITPELYKERSLLLDTIDKKKKALEELIKP